MQNRLKKTLKNGGKKGKQWTTFSHALPLCILVLLFSFTSELLVLF